MHAYPFLRVTSVVAKHYVQILNFFAGVPVIMCCFQLRKKNRLYIGAGWLVTTSQ